ncbi:PQQ-dependent sugar dehydrogenase [Larkinella soli]|uniref:PQQ-dependent sugar dehydrogenase n=1 Tax=Larkinella soli TaxID=1770527 RepID=UPI000FFB4C61|nr:PQQ-dependent sugar dehydrogenase [Larkinella soli]
MSSFRSTIAAFGLLASLIAGREPAAAQDLKMPTALRPDIRIAHVMTVEPEAVRILLNPVDGKLYYTTFPGDVFEITGFDGNGPVARKVLSLADHGINRLQGAAFHKNTLFLTGNVDANNKKGTKGRMVSFTNRRGKYKMTVIFDTEEYPTNKTTFDHGWNALEISPDGKYIFVNSGARTDHGEVQDNGGAYPNARDNGLTSKVFRFPIKAHDLMLSPDEARLKQQGYIYADGIRNAYDIAFDAEGNLFGVSNSSDYDHGEDMFWIREGRHYGFPWVMGGIDNPQQFADWQPDPVKDPFIPRSSHAFLMKYMHNDPGFPKRPEGVTFSPAVQNLGPDANEYRDRQTGKIMDGDTTGVTTSTFTAHCSPLALFFDTRKILADDLKGDGFVMRYSGGARSGMMRPFTTQGRDLLHLDLTYDKGKDNYTVKTKRIVEGFTGPTDAVLVGSDVYIIEYGGREGGHLWRISLPTESNVSSKNGRKNTL